MTRFLSEKYHSLTPYDTNGEHESGEYVRLNTNESPFPPSPRAAARVAESANTMNFYPDPDGRELSEKIAALYGVKPNEVLLTCGSDEALSFIFRAFCDKTCPAAFPEITYSFYEILADLNGVPFQTLPLNADFTVPLEKYTGLNMTLFLPNPNSPTGLYLERSDIERVIHGNTDNIVVIDEAYIDFGGESCAPLIDKYNNLLVVQTFSKSRSLAGARLGFCLGNAELIKDLNMIKNSEAPYNLCAATLAAGLGALEDEDCYTRPNCRIIIENRAYADSVLKELGFETLPSKANFILAKRDGISGAELAAKLKERGVLVRCYESPKALAPYVRITIGTRVQMEKLVSALRDILRK